MPAKYYDGAFVHGRDHFLGQLAVSDQDSTRVDGHSTRGQACAGNVESSNNGSNRQSGEICRNDVRGMGVDDGLHIRARTKDFGMEGQLIGYRVAAVELAIGCGITVEVDQTDVFGLGEGEAALPGPTAANKERILFD